MSFTVTFRNQIQFSHLANDKAENKEKGIVKAKSAVRVTTATKRRFELGQRVTYKPSKNQPGIECQIVAFRASDNTARLTGIGYVSIDYVY